MGVESKHEEECEVVSIPESLKTLLADFVVGGRVHDEHDEQHEVTCDSASLFVVNILSGNLPDLCTGYQEEGIPGGCKKQKTYGSSRR